MASEIKIRQMVTAEMAATTQRIISSRASSNVTAAHGGGRQLARQLLHRDDHRGGEDPRPTGTIVVLQARQPLSKNRFRHRCTCTT
jgi:hypothetical protein